MPDCPVKEVSVMIDANDGDLFFFLLRLDKRVIDIDLPSNTFDWMCGFGKPCDEMPRQL